MAFEESCAYATGLMAPKMLRTLALESLGVGANPGCSLVTSDKDPHPLLEGDASTSLTGCREERRGLCLSGALVHLGTVPGYLGCHGYQGASPMALMMTQAAL